MSAIDTEQNKTNENKASLCRSWCKTRNSRLRFGVLLVIVGLVWFGARMGFLPVEWFHSELFWPGVVVMVGSWIVFKSLIRRKYDNRPC